MYLCTEISTKMKTARTLTPASLQTLAHHNTDIYVSDECVIFYDARALLHTPILKIVSTPKIVEVGRIIRVTAGSATLVINLLPFAMQQGDVMVVPENNYIEIRDVSEDFNLQAVSYKNLAISFAQCRKLSLGEEDFERIGDYIHLAWKVVHKPSFSMQTIEHLLTAMMNDLKHLHQQSEQTAQRVLSHGEQIMQQFLELVAQYGATERNVPFYAERLLVTPNHLSSVIRQQSGQTVMQWLNARTLLQAKVLLKHSDQPICDIAFQLDFKETTLFSRFFLRETGMTPIAYRNS